MPRTRAQTQVQRSVGSNDGVEMIGQTDGRTNGRNTDYFTLRGR